MEVGSGRRKNLPCCPLLHAGCEAVVFPVSFQDVDVIGELVHQDSRQPLG